MLDSYIPIQMLVSYIPSYTSYIPSYTIYQAIQDFSDTSITIADFPKWNIELLVKSKA